jgi:hypothetical protein
VLPAGNQQFAWRAAPDRSIITPVPFFEPFAEPSPEPQQPAERSWAPPEWDRPSEGTLPAIIGVSRLLGRTDNVALAVDHVRVYPNGFQIVVSTRTNPRLPPELRTGGFASVTLLAARSAAPDRDDATTPLPPPPLLPHHRLHMGPRIGIRFSNGQSAGADRQSPFEVAKDEHGIPTGPVILGGGGGGGNGHFRFDYWVFPLPPPGELEVFAEWKIAGIEETSIVINGDDIRDAAQHATILWS